MAEALISAVLNQLVTIIDQEIEQEVRLVAGVSKEVQKLTSTLQTIRDVLMDAEKRQVKEEAVRTWLDKLRNISYDMDDVLDEWSISILKSQIDGITNGVVPQKKVSSYISFPCFCFNRFMLRHDIAVKIKELNAALQVIAKEKELYNFDSSKRTEEPERLITTSFVDVSEVCGRDQDKNEIVKMLLSDNNNNSQEPKGLQIISIVGMGGIGKTTLAQLAYSDNKVKSHFEKRIWVCVSDPFDEIRIAKAILESLKGAAPDVTQLETVLQHIYQSIKGKNFLLVLDDVWTEDYRKWEQISHCLRYGGRRSRILLTTRKERVADMIGTTHKIPLTILSKEDCWLLFSRLAFAGRDRDDCERLEGIGRKIADKCKGLPLAAKTLGSLMRFKRMKQEWRNVLESELWELEEAERGIFPPLLLSYYDLPSMVKRCFSYCAIFPKDYLIEKDELVKLWLAQGYLSSGLSTEMETTGHEYFESLVARSFFQDVEKDDNGNIMKCKMHDLVHDFAQFLTKNECTSMEDFNVQQIGASSCFTETRHISLTDPPSSSSSLPIQGAKSLHSFLYMSYSRVPRWVVDLLHHSTYLRALYLSHNEMKEIPIEIGQLIHLRYLNLSHCYHLKELPETLCNLCNLHTLKLDCCEYLQKLPQGVGKLVNLRHLEICATPYLTMLPKGITMLSFLCTLSKFIVTGSDDNNEACQIGDLRYLNHLRGHLEVEGLGNVTNANEAKKAELKNKKHIVILDLQFGGGDEQSMDDDVIETLEPPSDLESLQIIDYKGSIVFPNWLMSLTELQVVGLINCKNCEFLPPLGKLPFLESLQIIQMVSVKSVGHEFLGTENGNISVAFPKLKRLYFHSMKEWKEWDVPERRKEEDDTITIMPRLHYLEIEYCPKLKALPHRLTTPLEQLIIRGCPILEHCFQEGRKDWSKISHISNIQIGSQNLEQNNM